MIQTGKISELTDNCHCFSFNASNSIIFVHSHYSHSAEVFSKRDKTNCVSGLLRKNSLTGQQTGTLSETFFSQIDGSQNKVEEQILECDECLPVTAGYVSIC